MPRLRARLTIVRSVQVELFDEPPDAIEASEDTAVRPAQRLLEPETYLRPLTKCRPIRQLRAVGGSRG